ncbi:MAG: diguanylate cyclase [Aquabacterium sp.]|nr:diguanylate cyclase [Aquabacterium sp.]
MNIRGLQFRFMAMVVAITALLSIAAGTAAYLLSYQRATSNGETTLHGLMSAIEKSAAIGVYAQDKVLLQELIDGLAQNPLVAKVEVIDAKGHTLVSHINQSEHGTQGETKTSTVSRRLISPFDKGEHLGAVVITEDLVHMQQLAAKEAQPLSVMFVLQSVLLAIAIYIMGDRLVSQPIVRLAKALRRMQAGSSDQLRIPTGHEMDEIGSLVGGANALLKTNQEALSKERDLRTEVERMEAQYRQIFDSSSAGIFVLGPDGRLINCNPTVLRILGLTLESMQQLRGYDFVSSVFSRPDRALNLIDAAMRCGETLSDDMELSRSTGDPRWVHCLISVQGASQCVEGVMYDITERKHIEAKTLHQAAHDGLTGLSNRAACDDGLDHFIVEAARTHESVSVLYIDLDGFKRVNDLMGHKAGDQVLMQCAQRMKACLRRSSDVIGRVGGDEFVVGLYGVGSNDAILDKIASEIVQSLCEPIVLDNGQIARVGASVGMACFPLHGNTRKQVLAEADQAMYAVKHSGKNAYAMAMVAR